MADYRYQFCDALTGTLQAELPLACQSFSQTISDTGTMTGTLALHDITAEWRTSTLPKRALAIVLRDEQIAWGGWVIKRRATNSGITAEISAESLEGWLGRQEIQADLSFVDADVFTIVRALVAHVATQAGGNMRIDTGTGLAGYTQTVSYAAKDSTKLSDAVGKLADVAPGFEYTVRWIRSGNAYTPTLTMASPGLPATGDGIVLEFPGNALSYDWPEDGTAAPNALTGIGADTGGGIPLLARVEDPGELGGGYPRLPAQLQLKDETDAARLTARTAAALNVGLADAVIPTVELHGNASPAFGDFALGTAARLRLTSPYHPAAPNGAPGIDIARRVAGWTVTPGESEKVSLVLATFAGVRAPSSRQRTLAGYIADLDRRVRDLASRT